MTQQRETPVQLRRAIGAVRRAQQHEDLAARWWTQEAGWYEAAQHEWARAAMHLLQWGLS